MAYWRMLLLENCPRWFLVCRWKTSAQRKDSCRHLSFRMTVRHGTQHQRANRETILFHLAEVVVSKQMATTSLDLNSLLRLLWMVTLMKRYYTTPLYYILTTTHHINPYFQTPQTSTSIKMIWIQLCIPASGIDWDLGIVIFQCELVVLSPQGQMTEFVICRLQATEYVSPICKHGSASALHFQYDLISRSMPLSEEGDGGVKSLWWYKIPLIVQETLSRVMEKAVYRISLSQQGSIPRWRRSTTG